MRALLLIQSGDDKALALAAGGGADGFIIDGPRSGDSAKALLKLRQAAPSLPTYARIAALADADSNLDAIMPARPGGILLGEAKTGADLQQLSVKLSVREAELGFVDGSTKIIATVATSPASIFELGTLAGRTQRLAGLIFGADHLARALGQPSDAASIGLAKNLMLLAAKAAGVAAIDAAAPRDIDDARLRELCETAKRAGFHGVLAADLKQLAIIHSVFKTNREPSR